MSSERMYVATTYGCSMGTPMGYRVWLVDGSQPKTYWLRQVTQQDLHHIDAAILAERLNREMEAERA